MMISYAQNFEDVMLSRALGDIVEGFYVDVGAWHPETDSVTCHFYKAGWHGINIEPNPEYMALLKKERTRDQNLGIAVGPDNGIAKITIIHGTGMSTLHSEIAASHAGLDYQQEEITVATHSLNSIFEADAPKEVHFLKIDCEGAEADVINAFDFKRFRPWIVLVEATKPLSREESHGEWEPHILDGGYAFVYFDGVNRFYVANEHSDLARHFKIPPNVFDDFIVARFMIPVPAKSTPASFGLLKGGVDFIRSLLRGKSEDDGLPK